MERKETTDYYLFTVTWKKNLNIQEIFGKNTQKPQKDIIHLKITFFNTQDNFTVQLCQIAFVVKNLKNGDVAKKTKVKKAAKNFGLVAKGGFINHVDKKWSNMIKNRFENGQKRPKWPNMRHKRLIYELGEMV